MVDSKRLLADLTKLLGVLECDLRGQVAEREDVRATLTADYQAARQVGRTQSPFETWVEEPTTQAGAAWILGTVFVRFLEDNGLVEPRLSGAGARRTRALQEHQHFIQQHPTSSDRDYLEWLFTQLLELPATAPLFDRRHNPLWRVPISADAARHVVEFWQQLDPDSGEVTHSFTDDTLDTRFLGDLYQDLSPSVRKRYALLQTPRFVESFILDRTLTPAIETFGYREVTLIDPTCGSGHFLLGAFARLLDLAQTHEPGRQVRALVQDVLGRIAGVDINPYAVAISRFRLVVAALRACGIQRLTDAPGFDIRVATADSLLHGPRFAKWEDGAVQNASLWDDSSAQYYFAEDEVRVRAILGRQYHAVVGNPPYITVKDPALNALYRQRYRACHGKYALVVPFLERFFELALPATEDTSSAAGLVGMIVGNAFMKREFGKKVIEEYLPRWDLTHIADTSRAHIPGHGTPTVILFGRHRRPQVPTVRVAMGIKAELVRPPDASQGAVWTAIVRQLDQPGSESEYVTVADLDRMTLHHHPWSIGGGGAAELKELLDGRGKRTLAEVSNSIGITSFTLEDDAYLLDPESAQRQRLAANDVRPMLVGDEIRDWAASAEQVAAFPYDSDYRPRDLSAQDSLLRFLWPARTNLANNILFGGKTKIEGGLRWYEFGRLTSDKLRTPLSIAFAFVATHNHFVLDRGGKVFKQSAPVIKLPADASEEDHLMLLGLLNSSTACFWLKQACHNKGGGGIGGGLATEAWEQFYEFTAAGVGRYPVVTCEAAALATQLCKTAAGSEFDPALNSETLGDLAATIEQARIGSRESSASGLALQEELDWYVYRAYGLLPEPLTCVGEPPPLALGQRAFEIVMARRVAAGELETTWFDRHGSTPIPDLPGHWPDDYRQLVERRIDLIENDRYIGLIEQPEYKRRWNLETFDERLEGELSTWLLDRLESPEHWSTVAISSAARLADRVRQEPRFMEVAAIYTGRPDFDVSQLVADLIADDSVPFLPVLRYAETGLRKRAQWEDTWRLQREEDGIDARVGLPDGHPDKLAPEAAMRMKAQFFRAVPVPPKYGSADFLSQSFWRLRGKLDTPRERFISYPGCERSADGSLPIAWAGWDHARQARAVGAHYMVIKDEEGSGSPKLVPLLAGLLELLPWVRQWHSGLDPDSGMELAPFYEAFADSEARSLGLILDDVRRWVPATIKGPRRRKAVRQ